MFTLGTGTPLLGSGRMPPANAVIAGDEFIVIDAGEGASRTIGELFLPIRRIDTVLITHWHSDHFGGFGQILNQSWNADRHHDVAEDGMQFGLQKSRARLKIFRGMADGFGINCPFL